MARRWAAASSSAFMNSLPEQDGTRLHPGMGDYRVKYWRDGQYASDTEASAEHSKKRHASPPDCRRSEWVATHRLTYRARPKEAS